MIWYLKFQNLQQPSIWKHAGKIIFNFNIFKWCSYLRKIQFSFKNSYPDVWYLSLNVANQSLRFIQYNLAISKFSVSRIFFSVPIMQYWTYALIYFGISNFHMANFFFKSKSLSGTHCLLRFLNSNIWQIR